MTVRAPSKSLIVLVIVGLLVGFASPVAARQTTAGVVDLAAALPRPSDLEAIDLDGFVSGVGATGGARTLDRFDALYRGSDIVPVLARDGTERGSVLVLVRGSDLDESSPDRVVGVVSQFASVEDAGVAAQGLIDARARLDGSEIVPVAAGRTGDGDAPTIVIVRGNDPLGSPEYRQTAAIGVVDAIVVEVALEFTGADDPLAGDVETLFSVVTERLRSPPVDGAIPGNAIPVLVGDGLDPDVSRYVIVDGETVPVAGLDAEAGTARTERFATYGADQVVEFAYRSSEGTVTVGGYLSMHATVDDAEDYRTDIPDILRGDVELTGVRTANAIVRVGDGATLLTYSLAADTDVVVTELVVRFGTLVVELVVSGPDDAPASDMTALARAVESCVEDGACDPVVVPDDFPLPGS